MPISQEQLQTYEAFEREVVSPDFTSNALDAIKKLRDEGGFFPDLEYMQKYRTTEDMFLKKNQALKSNHNIRHHTGVQIGLVLLTSDLAVHNPKVFKNLGLTREETLDILMRVGMVHDTQRKNDDFETVPFFSPKYWFEGIERSPTTRKLERKHNKRGGLEDHGIRLAEMLEMPAPNQNDHSRKANRIRAVQRCLEGLSEEKKELVITTVRYHDAELNIARAGISQREEFKGRTQRIEQAMFLTKTFKTSDNLELVRDSFAFDERHKLGDLTAKLRRGQKPSYIPKIYIPRTEWLKHMWNVLHEYPSYYPDSADESPYYQNHQIGDLLPIYLPIITLLFRQVHGLNPTSSQYDDVMDAAMDDGIILSE